MKNLTPELMEKARTAKTTDELLALAKENGIEMTAEEAGIFFAQLNPASGELSDDELDNVAGGGCKTSSGQTVVSCGKQCFTGEFLNNWYRDSDANLCSVRKDNVALRKLWYGNCNNLVTDLCQLEELCGNCQHLEFKAGTGYCGKS